MYKFFGKRVLDIAISLWTLIIVSPLLAVISIILLVHTRKSPFFFQTRVGYRGKLFRVFKFKTLTDARDSEGLLLPDDLRCALSILPCPCQQSGAARLKGDLSSLLQ